MDKNILTAFLGSVIAGLMLPVVFTVVEEVEADGATETILSALPLLVTFIAVTPVIAVIAIDKRR